MTSYRILYHHRIRADDGQAVHVRELIGALQAQGHEVHECALVPKTGAAAPAGARARWLQGLQLPRTAVEILEILYTRRGAARLVRAAARFRPDFIYERHALHCAAGVVAAARLGVPCFVEVNSPMCAEMAGLGLLRFPRRARATEARVLQAASRIFTVSGVLAQMLAGLGAPAERIRIVPNGADPARAAVLDAAGREAVRQRHGLPAAAFLLGFVGFMRDWHRLDLVLQAMLRPGLGDLHFVLIGAGPALQPTCDRAAALGLQGRVHALGQLLGPAFQQVLAALDAALIPAINAYASPLKLFDSLAAGVPTLAPQQPNLEELLEDGKDGLLFRPGDAESLAERLHFLLADKARSRAIGRAGRDKLLARDWTWAGNARRVIAAFEELPR